jgi:hypothetical protein
MQLHDRTGKRLYLTAAERVAFMAAARRAAPEVRTLCAVLHDTGCRESELLEVTPERVDLTGGVLLQGLTGALDRIERQLRGELRWAGNGEEGCVQGSALHE